MRRLALPLLLGLLLAAATAGLVAGQSASAHGGQGKARSAAGPFRIAADYLGLERRALLQELRAGKSLAQLAEVRGKTRAGLEAALLAPVKARLDTARTAGKIDAARHARLLAAAEARIDRFVERTSWGRKARAGKGRLHGGGLLRAAATYLELTPRALVQKLREGTSLAEIATAQGKTRAGLKAALLARVTARLDRAVAAGKITSAERTTVLARIEQRVERMLDRKRTR